MHRWNFLLLALVLATSVQAKPRLQAVFSPYGGFDPVNKATMLHLVGGKEVKPNLNILADDMIRRVKKGGRIEIAMYAFSDMRALASMVDRAQHGVTVRLLLDACASWTTDLRKMVFEELNKQKRIAKAKDLPFDFQVKEVPCEKFKEFGRSKVLKDGKVITGTMHEKFGVFFRTRRKMPSNAFAGSANFAKSAATSYAENRTFFWNDSVAAAQLHEEFQRLWKYWGECSFGSPCERVTKIRNVEAGNSGVRMIFNGEPEEGGDTGSPKTVKRWRRIDKAIDAVIDSVEPNGTLDFAMFSFTHWGLKNHLLRAAAQKPKARFRVLLDLSMMADDNPDRPGVLGPMMEKEAKERGLKNFEVRYKWRSNAHSYDPQDEKVPPGLYHFKNHLLHHKLLLVNRKVAATGSYNWSGGAERRNLENLQIYQIGRPGHANMVNGFQREYDTIWNAPSPLDTPRDQFRPNPMVIGGDEGRALQVRIVKMLERPHAREVQLAMDKRYWEAKTPAKVAKMAGVSLKETKALLEAMREVTLLRRDKKGRYSLAD
jgi:phosphatidylserine/phosphatidylglycerophosphate/cardiolipin synthase-like enzyme